MNLSEKFLKAAKYRQQFETELESLGFEVRVPGRSQEIGVNAVEGICQSERGNGSVFNTLYESMGLGKRNEVLGFIQATAQQLRHRDFIKRFAILADDSREKIEQLFLPLEFYLLVLESQLIKLSKDNTASCLEFGMLRMQIFELRDMTREIKQEVLSCLASKDALSEADRKSAEQLIEALAKENKQGCQCCCDSPGNNADEDIHK